MCMCVCTNLSDVFLSSKLGRCCPLCTKLDQLSVGRIRRFSDLFQPTSSSPKIRYQIAIRAQGHKCDPSEEGIWPCFFFGERTRVRHIPLPLSFHHGRGSRRRPAALCLGLVRMLRLEQKVMMVAAEGGSPKGSYAPLIWAPSPSLPPLPPPLPLPPLPSPRPSPPQ